MSHQQRNCASLIFKGDADVTKQYSLPPTGVIVIGRSPDCQIVLDPFKFITVSRRHAQIKRVGSHWEIEDLGATNGTLVNDFTIKGRQKLQSGDRIILGIEGPEFTFKCLPHKSVMLTPSTINVETIDKSKTSHSGKPQINTLTAKTNPPQTSTKIDLKATILQKPTACPAVSAKISPKTLWNLVAATERSQFPGHSAPVLALAFSPDGQILASAAQDKTIKLWNRAAHTEIATFIGHKLATNALVFSADGKMASGGADKTIKLWQVETQAEIATFPAHKQGIESLSFSPDGQILASGSQDQTIKLWRVKTQAEIATLAGHKQGIRAIAFSPDGNTLASGSIDQTIRLWGVATKVQIAAISTPHWQTGAIAFAPDGQTIGGCDESGIIRLWQICSNLN